jgi:hypothetical protein
MGSSMNSLSPFVVNGQGASTMWNSIGSWFCIMGLIIGPFSIGILFEEKLQRANRELGSRLLRRY